MNPAFSRNHEPPKIYHGQYSTDLIRDKSFGFLDDAVKADKPFFLTIAPVAPHNNVQGGRDTKPIPAPRHRGLFKDVKIPRTKNFNPEQPSGASWVKELPRLNARQVENMDEWHRDRLRSLQAVDELVDKIVAKLIGYNLLSNTYIFFTTDNGFHIAQHRFKPGKTCGYEEDIRIPLIVRGPGVPKGVSSQIVTSHTDMAATFFDILGIPQRDEFDGSPIPLTEAALAAPEKTKREHVNIEFWSLRTPATQSIPGLSPVPGLPTIQCTYQKRALKLPDLYP
ncbi:putative arylsulfatase [Phaeomoniella chlamydospora]|uniref:Putative arylsulfatase n=1 Tax=Phaeomoniella chlamydospora TaxID=158046 RepID=A0A0G2DU43_PHACM|nr:putative arylsulfatase [Phaeomoniella chlamydospora]